MCFRKLWKVFRPRISGSPDYSSWNSHWNSSDCNTAEGFQRKDRGCRGIGHDITDRIAQEHEYFRLIDTANAPIFGVDTIGNINEWNQKIEEITGYSKATVLGLLLVNNFFIPESRQQVRQFVNRALIGVDVGKKELPMTTKQGLFLLLSANVSSKKDMQGNIRGAIWVGQNYTARKRMESAKVNFLASFSHKLRTPHNSVLGMLELLKEKKNLHKSTLI